MKKTLIIVGGVVVVLVIGLLAAPALIPVETYKTQLLAQIEKATGRQARIDGEFGLSLLPRVEFTAGKVSLANAPGGTAPNMLSLDKLDVRVAVFPLLSGTVVIDSFVLEKPQINLEIDRQGRPNWQFDTAAPAGAPPPAPTGPAPDGKDGGGIGLSGLQLGDVRLVGGRISYSDARTSTAHVVDDINMTLSLPSLSSPMKADGSLVWNKEKIALALGIANPNALLEGKSTAFETSVSGNPVRLTFKGDASGGAAVKAQGQIDLDVPSVRKLAAWAGQPLTAPGDGFGPLRISGRIGVDGQKYAFTGAKLTFDKIEATGDLRYDGSGRKPYVNARLDAGMLDLNPYLPPETPPAAGSGTGAPQQPPAAGQPAQEGWSDEPIDLTGLREADADLDLRVAGLAVRKIKVGKSQVKVALKDGRLVTDLTEMALYDGNGKARLSADGVASVPGVTATFDLAGLQANPALTDAIDLDRVEGTLNATMKIATRGRSQREMISALDGDGKLTFLDGAIRGINIGAMVRNVTSAFLDPKAREQQKTDFAELSGTFVIKGGILRNDDLSLLSPLLRVSGKGSVDMPKQSVNYRIEPKVVATTTGQGGRADAGGIMVPVIVSGPWSNLSYKPDLAGALGGVAQDPAKALEGLKGVLPGGKAPDSGETGGGSATPSPADALKKLFGR